MRKRILTSGFALATLTITTLFVTDEILNKLGIEKSNAQHSILTNLVGSDLVLPYTKLLPSIIAGDKVGAAKELCAYIKEYCKSDEFQLAYEMRRESAKPASEPPLATPEMIKYLTVSLQEMEKVLKDPAIKSMPKELTDTYKKGVDDIKNQLADSKDPTPNKTKWEKQYPVVADSLLKRKLKEYLAMEASVDYSAVLNTDKYGKKIFSNPDYEKKSPRWKACFRAGKEVNATIRAFVNQWLKEL